MWSLVEQGKIAAAEWLQIQIRHAPGQKCSSRLVAGLSDPAPLRQSQGRGVRLQLLDQGSV